MSQREYLIDVVKNWAETNKCPMSNLALGHVSALVIYSLRKETTMVDIFLVPSEYERWLEAGNEEVTDDQGKYVVYFDFIRLRKMSKPQQLSLVKDYEVQVLHPDQLKETFEDLAAKTDRDPSVIAKDRKVVQDLDVFLRRYW